MSKSVKNSREFENIIDLFGNGQIKKKRIYFLIDKNIFEEIITCKIE